MEGTLILLGSVGRVKKVERRTQNAEQSSLPTNTSCMEGTLILLGLVGRVKKAERRTQNAE